MAKVVTHEQQGHHHNVGTTPRDVLNLCPLIYGTSVWGTWGSGWAHSVAPHGFILAPHWHTWSLQKHFHPSPTRWQIPLYKLLLCRAAKTTHMHTFSVYIYKLACVRVASMSQISRSNGKTQFSWSQALNPSMSWSQNTKPFDSMLNKESPQHKLGK